MRVGGVLDKLHRLKSGERITLYDGKVSTDSRLDVSIRRALRSIIRQALLLAQEGRVKIQITECGHEYYRYEAIGA